MNTRGMDLAIVEINSRGGVRGRPLQVVFRDDQGDGSKAANVAGEFVANPAIVAVVGHVTSGAMVAAARVYDQGLPAISTTASSPDLSGISPWVFRVISSDSANGLDMARFVRRLGFRRASILYENNAYGRGLADSFRRGFGGDVLSFDPIPADVSGDYEPYVAFLRAKQPDVVFVAGMQPSGTGVLREARKQGLRSAFIGGDGWTPLALDTTISEGAYVGAPFSAEDPRAEAQRFVQAFRTRYHVSPDGNAALGYDATMLLARAIAEAGTSRRAVREWLTSLGTEWSFPGVTGNIRFRESGDVVGKGFVMTQIRRGALIPVRLDGPS
jgi:branched-chain amino acid transport system substrate-binding protein